MEAFLNSDFFESFFKLFVFIGVPAYLIWIGFFKKGKKK